MPRLKSYYFRLGISSGPAEDLAQEVLLKLWTKADKYDESKGTPSTWVFVIARNVRCSEMRKHGSIGGDLDVSLVVDPAPTPDEELITREIETRVHQVMRELPQIRANLLSASFFEEKSHSEIAQERNIPIGTVKSHLRRSLSRLRAALPQTL